MAPISAREESVLATLAMRGEVHREPASAKPRIWLWIGWGVCGVGLLGLTAALTWFSDAFGYDFLVAEMPILALTAGLMLASILYLVAVALTRHTIALRYGGRPLFAFVVAVGLAARLMLMPSEPVLEDDYQRYMWDGAVTANGLNPYAIAPGDVVKLASEGSGGSHNAKLVKIANASGLVLGRVNHETLRTIYPPVAQGFFAVAYGIKPFNLIAWRSVLLASDMVTLGFICLLLGWVGRSVLWSTLYWWNPIVLKELFNSAHMEGILLPFVLGAIVLAVRKRTLLATFVTGLAAGIKIWPVILLPLIWRPIWGDWRKIALGASLFGGLMLLLALPIFIGGVDANSGFVAYAQDWKTNSALFASLEKLAERLSEMVHLQAVDPGTIARGFLAVLLALVALGLAVPKWTDTEDLLFRVMLLISALMLMSPAQFPWYVLWVLPFVCFRPVLGFLLLTLTFQLYYYGFHLNARGEYGFFKSVVIWVIWVPVWLALIGEYVWRWRAVLTAPQLSKAS